MLTKEEIEKKYPGKQLSDIKILNFYGKDFSNIDIISQMKSLKIISLSSNKISSLKPFKSLPNLKELIIRNNNIEKIDEINYLQSCNKLKSLWISENPICKKEEYKKILVEKLPNLKTLDDTNTTEIKEEIEKNNESNINKNKFTVHEDKLEDLLLDYDQDENNKDNNNNNEKDSNNNQVNNKLLDSKSDIFKSNIINKDETKIFNKENNKNELNSNSENNKNIITTEPNSQLLNDILNNVDTSQSFIRKNNPNNNNEEKNKNVENNKKNNNDISLTRNLNDLINEAKLVPNNNVTNNNDIDSTTNYSDVDKILGEVDTSQTILKRNENKNNNEINNILKDVQSSTPEFNEINLNDKSEQKNIASIDDIRKIFNNDNIPNTRISKSNLYGNKNVSDTKINNIFKNEMISSESFTRNSSSRPSNNGPYKPDFNIPSHMQNYNYDIGYNKNNSNDIYNKNIKYEIKPSHENKIRAIINLMEDLSLENLLIVKNNIIKRLNGQK